MARSIRSAKLETRTGRLSLAIRRSGKPYTVRIAPGVRLAYRRKVTAGRWSVIAADGEGGNWLKAFADADDFESANGDSVLDFWQAQSRARILARGDDTDAGRPSGNNPATVAEALDNYEADLRTRGGDAAIVSRVRAHLPKALKDKPVTLLGPREVRRWRDGLKQTIQASSINRVGNGLRAALNLAAELDDRIVSRRAWEIGLQSIPDAVESRNVILSAETVRRIVTEAYSVNAEFGLLVELAATTGARVSQLARLEPQDVQGKRADPRLMMPSSKKGRGQKKIARRPVPIPEGLAMRLRVVAKQRSPHGLLLIKSSGESWKKSDHNRLFARAAKRAGVDPAKVTIYALRHSNIVRQLLAGTPVRVTAVVHDTSVAMVEKTYSKYISDHSDALIRPALLDLSVPASAPPNVVPLVRDRG